MTDFFKIINKKSVFIGHIIYVDYLGLSVNDLIETYLKPKALNLWKIIH